MIRNRRLPWIGIPTILTIFGMKSFTAMSNFRKRVYQIPIAEKMR